MRFVWYCVGVFLFAFLVTSISLEVGKTQKAKSAYSALCGAYSIAEANESGVLELAIALEIEKLKPPNENYVPPCKPNTAALRARAIAAVPQGDNEGFDTAFKEAVQALSRNRLTARQLLE